MDDTVLKSKLVEFDKNWGNYPEHKYEGYAIYLSLFELEDTVEEQNKWKTLIKS
jgi:hypothetical protein